MITKPERNWVIGFALLILLITSIPYVLGFFSEGQNWRFTGFVFGVEDGNSYIAKMLRGASGDWLFKTPYTAFPQSGFLAFLPYLILGKLTSEPGQHYQLVALFQIFRWVGGFILILATYDFLSLFLKTISVRRMALAIITIGGGLGWLIIFGFQKLWQQSLPLEFYSPESFGFLSIFGLPHLAMSRGLLLWGLARFLSSPNQKYGLINHLVDGLLWLAIGMFQPLTIITGLMVLVIYLLFLFILNKIGRLSDEYPSGLEWMGLVKRLGWIFAISAPFLIYNLISFWSDPFLRIWSQQNIIKSPAILEYILAYGWITPLLFASILYLTRKPSSKFLLIIGWTAIFPFLAYAPVNIQRRLPDGIWVAFVVLALFSVEQIYPKYKRTIFKFLYLAFPTTLLLFSGAVLVSVNPKFPLFVPEKQVKAMEYLNKVNQPDDVVLASYETSNYLPAWAPVTMLLGHGPESIHLDKIKPRVDSFFKKATKDEQRIQLIEEFNIHYIFWGPNERNLGDWIPNSEDFLTRIYDSGDYIIFRVDLEK